MENDITCNVSLLFAQTWVFAKLTCLTQRSSKCSRTFTVECINVGHACSTVVTWRAITGAALCKDSITWNQSITRLQPQTQDTFCLTIKMQIRF